MARNSWMALGLMLAMAGGAQAAQILHYLVLVDGDPTAEIGDIRRVAAVIKGRTAYYPSEILAELGVRPFAEPLRARPSGVAP